MMAVRSPTAPEVSERVALPKASYMAFAQEKGLLNSREQLTAMNKVLTELPLTFPDALSYLMKRAHLTIEGMEEKAGISARTISRMRTQERRDYSLDQVIAICIALQLPPWLSREMLAKAGFLLRPIKGAVSKRNRNESVRGSPHNMQARQIAAKKQATPKSPPEKTSKRHREGQHLITNQRGNPVEPSGLFPSGHFGFYDGA